MARKKGGDRRGQVWVETVIYTLIALSLIGLFITFAKPKVEEIQDKAIIEQSSDILKEIDGIILSMVQKGSGNQRIVEIGIKKGIFQVNGIEDQIGFEIDGKYVYTEHGKDGQPGDYVNIGGVLASTQKRGKISTVTLISNYSNKYNIQYKGGDEVKAVAKAPTPYTFLISNKGEVDGRTVIDFSLQ